MGGQWDELNARFHLLLDRLYETIEPVGVPVAVLAWAGVLAATVGMGWVLRRYEVRGVRLTALIVCAASLAAHLTDYAVTLRVSPDLAMEANPLWRIVIDRFGLGVARWYGLTGKILLSLLSGELFAFYLVQRGRLYPEHADGFVDFWRRFGADPARRRRIEPARLANVLAFSFALVGPFFFYVAMLNGLVDSPAYGRLPAMPLALIAYMAMLIAVYLALTYRAFCRSRVGKRPLPGGV